MLIVQFKRVKTYAQIPQKMSEHAAGYDLSAALEVNLVIQPMRWAAVPTGIAIALPNGFEAQIRPRSGLALNHGIGILNSPGTIDADYRGEIKVILFNFSHEPFVITPGMRIAQMIFSKVISSELQEVEYLDVTKRDEGGFGHTGY